VKKHRTGRRLDNTLIERLKEEILDQRSNERKRNTLSNGGGAMTGRYNSRIRAKDGSN